ncbi:MAG TPA: tRNA (cytidine(34)-2'-O)-methyltransferase [Tepidisphaeraceae bacterium]|jgi:tRNA (cytidine/uridine-2'-O-)-methyltransferase|nr:tRNA (cytidine(34)-2'-O)-methyltransferase [Tepidisphaeraceae bacterium]
MSKASSILPPHSTKVALLRPQIAPNTGNIARMCVATGTELHLVRPLGFILSDKQLKRSAMDYWPRLKLTVHDDAAAFLAAVGDGRMWLFTTKADRGLWQADFRDGDWLVFGSETHGIDDDVLSRFPDQTLRIPQAAGERCLNLSTAAGIGLYEALRATQAQR